IHAVGPSTSAPATVTTSAPAQSSGPALVTYIQDLQATPDSEPFDTQGVAQLNGVSYPDSQGAQFCFGSNERKWTYVLGRKYSSLQGTIGLSDNSVATAKIRFEILADGRSVYSKDLQVGQSEWLDVPGSSVGQLELDTILLTQDGGCGAATGEWANIHAVGPSTSAPATVTTSASATQSGGPALVTYIQDLQATPDSEPFDTQGVAQVNGVSYPDSQGAQFCFGSNERKWTYVLGRKYSSLQGTIGLSDNSVATAKIRFEILADGRSVYSKDLQVGQSAPLNVPVSNVLQLELDTILLTQDGGCGAATGEWADIHAVGPSTSAPATVTTSASATQSGGPALVTYIQALQAAPDSEPFDTQGVAQVNGVSYPDSQGAQFCFGSNERKWTHALGRKYSSLQGTIG